MTNTCEKCTKLVEQAHTLKVQGIALLRIWYLCNECALYMEREILKAFDAEAASVEESDE